MRRCVATSPSGGMSQVDADTLVDARDALRRECRTLRCENDALEQDPARVREMLAAMDSHLEGCISATVFPSNPTPAQPAVLRAIRRQAAVLALHGDHAALLLRGAAFDATAGARWCAAPEGGGKQGLGYGCGGAFDLPGICQQLAAPTQRAATMADRCHVSLFGAA